MPNFFKTTVLAIYNTDNLYKELYDIDMIAFPGKLIIMNIYYKFICHVEKHCGLYKGVDTCADTQAPWLLYKLGAKIILARG